MKPSIGRVVVGIGLILLLSVLLVLSSRKVTRVEAQGSPDPLHPVEVFTADSSAKSLIAAFTQAGVTYFPEDIVQAFPDPALGLGTVVRVERATPITIRDGKKTVQVRTWKKTVGEVLSEKRLDLGNEDRVGPTPVTLLQSNMTVTITRVARTEVVEKEIVPYETVIEKDYTQFVGTDVVLEQGKNGEREKRYLLIREDGELVSKTLLQTTITLAAQKKKVRQGSLKPVSSRCLQYKDWVVDASKKNGIDPNALYYRMQKESSCNPNSVGYGPAGQIYEGMFQYEKGGLWNTLSTKAGFSGTSVWDAKAQIYTTAWAWANGHRSRWPNP